MCFNFLLFYDWRDCVSEWPWYRDAFLVRGHLCLLCNAIAIYQQKCVQKALDVTDDQNKMDLLDPYLVHSVKQLNANDRKPCSLRVYHEINCRISVNRPAHLFIKVISNTVTQSQTKDKIICNSAITEEKTPHLYIWFQWWLVEISKEQNFENGSWIFLPLCDV